MAVRAVMRLAGWLLLILLLAGGAVSTAKTAAESLAARTQAIETGVSKNDH